MVNKLKMIWLCKLWGRHLPPTRKYKRMYGEISVCKRCRHKIKLRSNGEWDIWQ